MLNRTLSTAKWATLWLALFGVSSALFFVIETPDVAKATAYGALASSLKYPAVWMHGLLWMQFERHVRGGFTHQGRGDKK